MATNLPDVMTFAQACEYFTTEILPMIQEQHEQDGEPDWPARFETCESSVGRVWWAFRSDRPPFRE